MAEEIFCNICGKKLDFFDTQEDFTHTGTIQYGSKHDGEQINLHICCSCMDKIIESCKITPIKSAENF